MSNLSYLRIVGYVLTLSMHIGNLVYVARGLRQDVLEDSKVRQFADTRRRYFTCWNFGLQMIHAMLGFTCEMLLIKNDTNKNYTLPKYLKGCRDTIFTAILWPATLLVFTVFWTLFLYDRSLIFPDFIDKVLTPASNHIMHTAIVPVVLWEVLLQPRYEPKSHVRNIKYMVGYMLVYLCVLVYTYLERGIWLYPIFKKLHGTRYLPLLMLFLMILMLFFYHLQWTICNLVWGKQKPYLSKAKEKQKKRR